MGANRFRQEPRPVADLRYVEKDDSGNRGALRGRAAAVGRALLGRWDVGQRLGVDEELPAKSWDTPPDDDPGSPFGSDVSAKDHPEQGQTETDPQNEADQITRQSRNADVDFCDEKRSNATHASLTDPDARLYKKSPGTGAMLCFNGHALM